MFNSIRLLVSLFLAAEIFHAQATNSIDGSNAVSSAETILNDMNNAISTTHLMNRASPQCWMESITTISQWGSVSGASYCASMTTEQQKVLALELTNCQLMEENRALFIRDDDSMQVSKYASCHVGEGGTEPYEVSSCLRFMTDFALNLYHQMLLYANDVCNRLTNDMMEQQKEETTLMLIKASSAFVDLTRQQQMEADLAQQDLLEAISRNKVYLEEHQQQWEEANQARQMELARAQEARERAAEAREREVEAREKAALLAMQEMVETNTMHFQEQQQKWEELNSARDKEMHVVEERREQTEAIIKKQQYDMERMQEVRCTSLQCVKLFYLLQIVLTLHLLYISIKGNRKHKLANAAVIKYASLREDGHKWFYSVEVNLDLLLVHECIMDAYYNSIAEKSKAVFVCNILHRICYGACSCVSCRRYVTCRWWSEGCSTHTHLH